ncbi:MAG: FG-GAP repeat domain-containing protein, partial [Myxococcota bacterium]
LWDGASLAANLAAASGTLGEGINGRFDTTSQTYSTLYTGLLSVVADLDRALVAGKFTQEVVTGRTVYTSTGAIKWQADSALPDGFPAIGDFNDDGIADVVVSADGTVRIHDGEDGVVIWGPVEIEGTTAGSYGGRIGPPTVADFDGDGKPEIGVAGKSQYVALSVNLPVEPAPTFAEAKLWSVATQDASSNMTGSSVFDFEGDGKAEVVYNDELKLRVYDGSTGAVLYEQANTSYTALEYPIIVDVDNDGRAEIVVSTNDFECEDVLTNCTKGFAGIRVLGDAENNWVSTRRIWNQHSYHISNINEDGTLPSQEAPSWVEHNTYRLNALLTVDPQAAPDAVPYQPFGRDGFCDASVEVWVYNQGSALIGAGLPVSFYLLGGATPTLLGTVSTLLPLEPGDAEKVRFELDNLNDGDYTVRVVIDDDGTGTSTLNECDGSNNRIDIAVSSNCG